MEGSTVSPPPASLSEGDDLCETDVTNVAKHSVMLLICLSGLAGNGAVLWIHGQKGLAYTILNLAFSDFAFLLLAVPSALLFLLEDLSCSVIMSPVYLSFLFQLSMVSWYWGLFRLTDIGIPRYMAFLCWRWCSRRIHLRVFWVVVSAEYWALLVLFAVIPTVTSQCPSHEQDQCRMALIVMYATILLLSAAPMVIYGILFIYIKCGSQKQQPERRDIVIVLILFFTLLLSLWNILQQLGYTILSSQDFFWLTCIHSSIKPFIYFTLGSSWRPCSMESCRKQCSAESLQESLQRLVKNPEDKTPSSNDAATDTVI